MNDQFIQGVIFDWDKIDKDSYLKGIRAFKGVEKLDFNKPITFFLTSFLASFFNATRNIRFLHFS